MPRSSSPRTSLVTLALALTLSPALADAPKPPPAAPPPAATTPGPARIHFDIRRAKLDNGLRIVLAPDHASPTIAIDVVYDVGGRNEERGRSGFAHLFEHMMFQGSANVVRGQHFKLVTGHGGMLNGTTSEDRTNYFEMLPQSELGLALWLEADRMKSLDISLTNFENQRAVVKEEYRMRVDNQPYRPSEIRLQELVFQGYFPYEHSAIGTMADLDAAQLDWVRAFHDAYYAPNNAVLVIAGDFDPDEAMALIRKNFGDAKPQPQIPPYQPGTMAPQKHQRDAIVEDIHARFPAILYGWAIPPARDPEHYPLELLAMLLGDGESSRLNASLVRDKAIATEADAGTNDQRGPDMFEISVKVASSSTPAAVEKALFAELARIKAGGPTDDEMKKLQARLEAHFLMGLQSNIARAQKLGEYELFFGDANLLTGELDRYFAVKKEDIAKVAAKYLTNDRLSRVEVKPPPPAAPPPAATAPKAGAK
ncbi:pitrilysin family protein [soil metagenome]